MDLALVRFERFKAYIRDNLLDYLTMDQKIMLDETPFEVFIDALSEFKEESLEDLAAIVIENYESVPNEHAYIMRRYIEYFRDICSIME